MTRSCCGTILPVTDWMPGPLSPGSPGETERIWLVALVERLHRRLPTVIGRQIASLDLLSNGRAELAFGTVTSLNEIEALEEAIDIVRAILDVSDPGTVAIDGRHFPVMGAQRGPLPLHTIPIWLSGIALPVLELAGQTADGWIGTPQSFRWRTRCSMQAPSRAGRDPSEISRIVVVQGDEALLPLVLEEGAGIFLLDSNDPDVIERFATETIPDAAGCGRRSACGVATSDSDETGAHAREAAGGYRL